MNEYQKQLKQQEQDFVEEFMIENVDWVKCRRVEFLKQEMEKIDQENYQWMRLIAKCQTKWFAEEMKKEISVKEYKRLDAEVKMYEEEKTFWKSELTADEIEQAHNADCSQFIDIVRREGKRAWAICPFHNEKTPSFCCYEDNGFYCFGCGVGGDCIDLVQKLYNLKFKETIWKILKK